MLSMVGSKVAGCIWDRNHLPLYKARAGFSSHAFDASEPAQRSVKWSVTSLHSWGTLTTSSDGRKPGEGRGTMLWLHEGKTKRRTKRAYHSVR